MLRLKMLEESYILMFEETVCYIREHFFKEKNPLKAFSNIK